MSIANVFPTVLDNGLRDGCFDRARTLGPPTNRNHGRGNRNHLAAHDRPAHFHVKIDVNVSLETQTLDRLLTARSQFVIIWSLIYDRRIVVGNVGHVGRLIDDGDVALARHDVALDLFVSKFPRRDEAVLVGANVVIVIGPIMNAAAAIEARFRRQRRPADIFIALAP